ncbi:hypothetical protein BV25DRAFT_1621299 [Artomyces pyxidatus]|uniref:Uncharacterized protein n=1 Tax=Artomyces pyxidatus TaxID=48021 RepID=A0ACB8TBP6_9AGAM|nr:hypothetical protein BV25DRAFT_1621299 [Artomyces pyxidatus]
MLMFCLYFVFSRSSASSAFSHKQSSVENAIRRLSKLFISPQQRRRGDEWSEKCVDAVLTVLGDHADQYFSIDGLYTHPDYQGRGFASTLVNAITEPADKHDRPTLLVSVYHNFPFYESFGFQRVMDFTLGEDDPDWDAEPILVSVMVRQPQVPSRKDQ